MKTKADLVAGPGQIIAELLNDIMPDPVLAAPVSGHPVNEK